MQGYFITIECSVIYQYIFNLFMSYLRTIDPLKGLKGKLNFLRQQNQPIYQVLKLVNSLAPTNKSAQSESSLQKLSIQDIQSLTSPTTLNAYEHKKMVFESHIHKHSNLNAPVGTIYQQLDKSQKKLLATLLKFSDRLNARQMAYLQYAMRLKLNSIYPSWNNLHLNNDSPFRKQFPVLPTLTSLRYLNDIKVAPKKKTTTAIIASRKKTQQAKA